MTSISRKNRGRGRPRKGQEKGARRGRYVRLPTAMDRALRARARRDGRSVNDVVIAALEAWIGEGSKP